MTFPLSDLERALLGRRAAVPESAVSESAVSGSAVSGSAVSGSAVSGSAVSGSAVSGFPVPELVENAMLPGQKERYLALLALARGDEQAAGAGFRRSSSLFETGSRDWAVSERFYGLVLIRLGREVEGTFVLERADFVLDLLELEHFDLGEL